MQQMDYWWIGAAMESFSHNLNKRDRKRSFVVESNFFSWNDDWLLDENKTATKNIGEKIESSSWID